MRHGSQLSVVSCEACLMTWLERLEGKEVVCDEVKKVELQDLEAN